MRRNDRTVQVEPYLVPEPRDAVAQFESLGGHLTLFSPFGEDPLKDRADLISQKEREYFAQNPDFGPIFHSLVNSGSNLFRCGLLLLIQASKRLESQLEMFRMNVTTNSNLLSDITHFVYVLVCVYVLDSSQSCSV